jgi:hypothetical protein
MSYELACNKICIVWWAFLLQGRCTIGTSLMVWEKMCIWSYDAQHTIQWVEEEKDSVGQQWPAVNRARDQVCGFKCKAGTSKTLALGLPFPLNIGTQGAIISLPPDCPVKPFSSICCTPYLEWLLRTMWKVNDTAFSCLCKLILLFNFWQQITFICNSLFLLWSRDLPNYVIFSLCTHVCQFT